MLPLVTAVVVETHEEWQIAERRYLSEGSMAKVRDRDTEQTEPHPAVEAPLAVTT